MKKIIKPVGLRAAIAVALSLSFIIYPQLRVSAVKAAYAAADLKSQSRLRTDAARYENAIRAIGEIATMKLETPDDLKRAIAILNRERPNLRFHLSKLVVMGINDSTLSSAAKKRVSDKQAAEAFAKELDADPKAVLKLNGAAALQTRMRQSSEADAATLRRVAERLKEAAEKIKKTRQARILPRFGATDELKLIRANFNATRQPVGAPNPLVMFPQGGLAETIVTVLVIVFVVVVVVPAAIGLILVLGTAIKNAITNLFTEDGQDALSECQKRADDELERCLDSARIQPFPLNLAGETICNTNSVLSG